MVKIIKDGDDVIFKTVCWNCGSLLSYRNIDSSNVEYDYDCCDVVNCPKCYADIEVDFERDFTEGK